MVVASHFRDLFKGTHYEILMNRWLTPGAFGVDFFFIISGFIITYAGFKYSPSDSLSFLLKRALRIWPPYAFWSVIFFFVVHGFEFNWLDIDNLFKRLAFIPLNLNSAIYFGSAVLYPGWTLNYEAYFYLCFSICLLLGKGRYIALIGWFLFTVIALPIILGIDNPKPVMLGAGYTNLVMQRLLLEFIFGVICALAYKNERLRFKGDALCLSAFAIALGTPVFGYISGIKTNDHGPTNFGLYYMISFSLLILSSEWIKEHIRFPKWLVFTGNISFSIYLTHIVVVFIITHLISELNVQGTYKALLTIASCLPVIVLTSYLSYIFLERKLHDKIISIWDKRVGRSLA